MERRWSSYTEDVIKRIIVYNCRSLLLLNLPLFVYLLLLYHTAFSERTVNHKHWLVSFFLSSSILLKLYKYCNEDIEIHFINFWNNLVSRSNILIPWHTCCRTRRRTKADTNISRHLFELIIIDINAKYFSWLFSFHVTIQMSSRRGRLLTCML